MVLDHYVLKYSRLATVFQLVFIVIIGCSLWMILRPLWWGISLSALLLIWYLFRQQRALQQLARLDQDQWSLQWQGKSQIQRVTLTKMVQHHFYIVLYFAEKSQKPIVIWRDQFAITTWKRLLMQVHLR